MDQAPEEPEKLHLIASSSLFFVIQNPGTLHFLTLDGALPERLSVTHPNAHPSSRFPRNPPPLLIPHPPPSPPHPQELEGCRKFSIFDYDSPELTYFEWCYGEMEKAVRSQCKRTGTAQEEQACAEDYLEGLRTTRAG